jgi:hypothetical protein
MSGFPAPIFSLSITIFAFITFILNITPPMTSNLLQGVLKHSAHERLDALVHDKDDDSDDELVNVVCSILYSVGPQYLLICLVFTSRNTCTLSPINAALITISRSTWPSHP